MVHGYHLILPMYGFWLPNDPRGSWSDYVWKWELVNFGKATKGLERRELSQLTESEIQQRKAARQSLQCPPVVLTGRKAAAVGKGFAKQCRVSNYTIWVCAILPEHTHLVIARHTYGIEQIARLLKGAATTRLLQDDLHPLKNFDKDGTPRRPWAESMWKVFWIRKRRLKMRFGMSKTML